MYDKIRLLLIEDNPGDARLVEELLKESGIQFELACCDTLSAGITQLATASVDVVLLDLGLTDCQGLDTLHRLIESKPGAPVVVLTGLSDESVGFQAIKGGAQDYLVKGQFDSRLLARSLRYAIGRQQIEQMQKKTAAQWQTTFDSTKELYMLLDKDFKIIRANRATRDFLGRPYDELIGRHCFTLMHDTNEPLSNCPLARMQQSLAHEEAELFLSDRNMWVSVSVDPIFDDNGKLAQVVHITEDITERKQAEERHRRLEEQLRMAQKMEAIGQLAGGVAHDFNNLLSVILGYTDFAISRKSTHPELRDDLLEVRKAGERAAELTRQLLAFSRKQIMQPRPIDLNEIVTGLDKMLRRTIGEDIELVLGLTTDLDPVMADPGQVEQVIINVVVNARDAMPQGGRLTLETARVEVHEKFAAATEVVTPGPYVQLAVTDTGCGMDEQTRIRLFEPFFTTKEKGKGTGLGLAMAYGIIKQSKGYIIVNSEPGRGACFCILLPSLAATTARAPEHTAGVVPAAGTETIMVVEDDEGVRRLTSKFLWEAGYTVLLAADVEEVLLLNRHYRGEIHLLLADVVMPRASGPEVAGQVVKTRPELKVIYMSGYTGDAIAHYGVLDPGTHFIAKPFEAAELLHKIREVLDGTAMPRRPHSPIASFNVV